MSEDNKKQSRGEKLGESSTTMVDSSMDVDVENKSKKKKIFGPLFGVKRKTKSFHRISRIPKQKNFVWSQMKVHQVWV